jgi:salicylate hydroxylase
VLIDRALELGATMECNARAIDVRCDTDSNTATVVLADGREQIADLVIGADGIHSRMREVLVGKLQPPKRTGDLAYRLLLDTKKLMNDPDLAHFVAAKEVNYWIGPGAHVGTSKLRAFSGLFMLINLLVSHLYTTKWRTLQHGPPRSRRYAGRRPLNSRR